MVKVIYKCKSCGKEIDSESNLCPVCGVKERCIYLELNDKIGFREVFKLKLKSHLCLIKVATLIRDKLSGLTKRPTKEVLTFDRTDLHKTTKYHHVEEVDNGVTQVVHHEFIEYPAKRR